MGIRWKSLILPGFLLTLVWKVSGKNIQLNSGEQFTIDCPRAQDHPDEIFLHKRMNEEIVVVSFKTGQSQIHTEFKGLVKTETVLNKLRITLINLKEEQSGVYWCTYSCLASKCEKNQDTDSALVVVVGDNRSCNSTLGNTNGSSSFLTLAVLSGCSAFLVLLILGVWLVAKLKRYHKERRMQSKPSDSIYEDMRAQGQHMQSLTAEAVATIHNYYDNRGTQLCARA